VKNLVIAKRYAKALFTLAREVDRIEEYGRELGEFPGAADTVSGPCPRPPKSALSGGGQEISLLGGGGECFHDPHHEELSDAFDREGTNPESG
jgi:ATP synthase delta (OSCP) subunit.